jgi:transcription elongation factor Elf1
MLSIVRCPGCGKATVAVGKRNRAQTKCSRCGQALDARKLAVSDPDTLETRVREVYRHRGLGRPR